MSKNVTFCGLGCIFEKNLILDDTGAMRACEEGGNEDAQESCRCTQSLDALHARYL